MGNLKLSSLEMARLENARLRGELAETRKTLFQTQKMLLEQRISHATTTLERLTESMERLVTEEREAKETFDTTRLGVERRLGVDLNNYECDADSGVLRALPAKE